MGKIKNLAIDLQNARAVIEKEADFISNAVTDILSLNRNHKKLIETAYIDGALSPEAKEYWKIKLQAENEGS
jgi:hypothetical protein